MNTTYWHRFVCLYHMGELELAEIVKTWIINTSLGVIHDDTDEIIGYGVLDNTRLYEALIAGLLCHETPKPLLQADMADMLMCHTRTIRSALKRLEDNGFVQKDGLHYRLVKEPVIPLWIREFTKAMLELRFDDELLTAARQESAKIHFKRGVQIVKEELREKYYRPRKPKSDEDESGFMPKAPSPEFG